MTETTIKEIPVQIINAPDGSTIAVRVPPDWSQEQCYRATRDLMMAMESRKVNIIILQSDMELAIIDK